MRRQHGERCLALIILLLAGLASTDCVRVSKSSSEELKPRRSAVQVGEMAPDFTLEDQHNQKVTLSATWGTAPAVLVFYRGYW